MVRCQCLAVFFRIFLNNHSSKTRYYTFIVDSFSSQINWLTRNKMNEHQNNFNYTDKYWCTEILQWKTKLSMITIENYINAYNLISNHENRTGSRRFFGFYFRVMTREKSIDNENVQQQKSRRIDDTTHTVIDGRKRFAHCCGFTWR